MEGDIEHPFSGMAVVLADGRGGQKRMYVGRHFAGCKFHDSLRKIRDAIVIDGDGFGNFYTQDSAAAVWVRDEAFEQLVINED